LRVFILDYFSESATEDGHRSAGHGQGMFMAEQRERMEMRKLATERRDRDASDHDPECGKSGPDPAG
jgi:hypothetical protein